MLNFKEPVSVYIAMTAFYSCKKIVFLQGAGFTARVATADAGDHDLKHNRTIKKWRTTFIFSLMFAIPTVIIAFVPYGWKDIVPGLTAKEVVLFLLSTIIQASGRVCFNIIGVAVWSKLMVVVHVPTRMA